MHAWQHLGHFFSTLLGSKEFWAATLGAVFGGLITGRYALRAQTQAAKDQRTRDRDTELETVRGTLEAIATEVEVFKAKFLDAFKRVFEEANPNASPANSIKFARTSQSLFSVFDSSASVLGRITDAALRRKIVATYVSLKAVVDVVNHYTERQGFFENVRYRSDISGGGINDLQADVEKWAGNVKRNIPRLEQEIAELLADIKKYLDP